MRRELYGTLFKLETPHNPREPLCVNSNEGAYNSGSADYNKLDEQCPFSDSYLYLSCILSEQHVSSGRYPA
jgi:hypothetical protein